MTGSPAGEENFRLAVEAAPYAILLVDEHGRIILVNAHAERLFGYAREELLGQPVEVLVPQRLRAEHPGHRRDYLHAPESRLIGMGRHLHACRKDGTEIPVEIGLNPIVTESGVLVLAAVVDITERRRTEEALKRSEAEHRATFELSAAGQAAIDPRTTRFLRVNRKLSEFLGYTQAELLEWTELDLTHPLDRGRDRDGWERLVRGELSEYSTEKRYVRKDGSVVWGDLAASVVRDDDGTPVQAVAVIQDITPRKQAQEQREAAERRVAVLDDVSRSITSALDLDVVLQRVVQGARELCESDAATIFLRDGASETMAPRYWVGHWMSAHEHLRIRAGQGIGGHVMLTGRPMKTDHYLTDPRTPEEFRAVARETGTTSVMVLPILIDSHVEGLLVMTNLSERPFTDEDETICARLADQAAIAIQNARLFASEQAARSEAEAANRGKDEFLAMLGHELRNPLSAILAAVAVLERIGKLGEMQTRSRDIIRRQTELLTRLVDDLLDIARLTTGKVALHRRPVNLAEAVEHSLTVLRSTGRLDEHKIEARLEPAWVDGDTARLEEVIMNLLTNSIKYTPAGGRISVEVASDGDEAIVRVEDTGIGISVDLLPRVFDLFAQGEQGLDRRQGGLGIGLTLVRRLVEMHGGRVTVRSDGPGHGSAFTVRLPRIAAPAPKPAVIVDATPIVDTTPTARRSVLIAEDNRDARTALRALLETAGHEVHEAEDGQTAVELGCRIEPDVALIDIGLPRLDGYEVARRLKMQGRRPRLIALTGYGQPADRERAAASGFDAHLVKPIDGEALLRALVDDEPLSMTA